MTGLFVILFYSCQPTLYLPSSPDASQQQQLLEGRKLYVSHCSSCHNLHFPKEYSKNGWEIQLEKMQYRARINDNQKQLIYDYLTEKE